MDIKDYILIGGGLLIAAVIAHGFWIAWREGRRDLRFDIQPDLIPDLIDDMARLKGELPNGGARVSRSDRQVPEQNALELEERPPLLLEPSEGPPPASARSAREPTIRTEGRATVRPDRRAEPRLQVSTQTADPLPERILPATGHHPTVEIQPQKGRELPAGSRSMVDRQQPQTSRSKVTEVAMPETLNAEQSRSPRRLSQRHTPDRVSAGHAGDRSRERAEPAASAPVEELLILNVLADRSSPFTGDGLFTVLRSEGLKFGEMNIFHRVEPLTKIVHYSIANAVEPGTFDMSEMESFRSPGLCLFLQLPGPENPLEAFEDMLKVARTICRTLGGEMKDEQRNVMTPQTVEHYRQRVTEFSRRRMSKRA